MPRHTYTTRMLYTVVPSECYAPKSASQMALMEALAADLNMLYISGLQVTWQRTKLARLPQPLTALRGFWRELRYSGVDKCTASKWLIWGRKAIGLG